MMVRPLGIDDMEQRIAVVREYAMSHRIPLSKLMANCPVGNDSSYVCECPDVSI